MPDTLKRGRFRIFIAFASAILSAGIACKSEKEIRPHLPDKPNVVLITLDTTRADHLPVYGYKEVSTPNLDSLAKDGILFRQCTSSSPLTLPAHSTIMTGTYPTYHGVRINGNTALAAQQHTLAEAFAEKGYQTGAFVAAFVLDGRWGLNQGFQHYDDHFDLMKYKNLDLGVVQRPANEVVDAALAWLQGKKNEPFFTWVHLYDPHVPYAPPEPYRSQYASRGMKGLYDGEIAFMDVQIGRLIQWLNESGLRKNTVIAVIGDHGEGLGDHGEMTHGYFIYDYAVHVPFILSTPDEQLNGLEISAQVRTLDLYPTLLQASNISIPKEVHGSSLWPLIKKRGSGSHLYAYSESMVPSMQYGWSPLLSLRTTEYKYIDAPRPEFYDLKDDPREETNLKEKRAKPASDYEKTLKSVVLETSKGAPAPGTANLDSETMERMAALGYIGGPVTTKASAGASQLVDPKDRLPIHEAIQKAGEFSNNDQHAEAVRILETVLRDDPENPQARLLLAGSYRELKRTAEAKTLLQRLLDEDSKNIRALVSLASVLQDEGKPEEVIRISKKIVQLDDRNTQALAMIGRAYMDVHEFNEALPWLQKAVEVQPKLTQNQLNLAACQIGLKQYGAAEASLKTIIAEYPRFPMAHFHLGLVYDEQGKLLEASREYEMEIQTYGKDFMARFNLGRLKLRMGDPAAYMEQMREIVRIAPNSAAGYLFLARGMLQENANTDEILSLTQKGLSLARSSEYKAMGYFLLADIYNRKKQPQQVKQALLKANEYKAQIQ